MTGDYVELTRIERIDDFVGWTGVKGLRANRETSPGTVLTVAGNASREAGGVAERDVNEALLSKRRFGAC